MTRTGVKNVLTTSGSGAANGIFRGDSICAISQHISRTKYRDTMSHKFCGKLRSHHVFEFRRDVFQCVSEREIKRSSDVEVHCSAVAEIEVQSLFRCSHVNSDKSQATLVWKWFFSIPLI